MRWSNRSCRFLLLSFSVVELCCRAARADGRHCAAVFELPWEELHIPFLCLFRCCHPHYCFRTRRRCRRTTPRMLVAGVQSQHHPMSRELIRVRSQGQCRRSSAQTSLGITSLTSRVLSKWKWLTRRSRPFLSQLPQSVRPTTAKPLPPPLLALPNVSIRDLTRRVCDVMALHHESPPDFIADHVLSSLDRPGSQPGQRAVRLAVEFGCELLKSSAERLLNDMSVRFGHLHHMDTSALLTYIADELSLWTRRPSIPSWNPDVGMDDEE